MTECLVSSRAFLHKSIYPAVIVKPVKAPLYLPPLPGVSGFPQFRPTDPGAVVVPANDARSNGPFFQIFTNRVAVIALVGPEPFRSPHPAADRHPVNRSHRKDLIVSVGFPAGDRQEIAV